MPVLDTRTLNRATLARQLLLERADLPVLDAVARLGGLQAQEPQEPFIGLWSRLRAFDPAVLDDLLLRRRVVRAGLMRCTIHLVTADDMLAWRARHDAMLRQRMLGVMRPGLVGVDLDELAAAGRKLLAEGAPLSVGEVSRALADRWPTADQRALGQITVAALVPVVQAPPRGLWKQKGGARYHPLAQWIGRDIEPAESGDGDRVGQALVRRYLAAYGPASSADLRAWCGLARLPAAVRAVRPELISFRDARGRELLDLPDAPRPDPDTPAPVRFLPAFDNAILGYQDRSRIIDGAHRGLSVASIRVVLVDGRVSATWTVQEGAVVVTALRAFTPSERAAVGAQGEELARFLAGDGSRGVRIEG